MVRLLAQVLLHVDGAWGGSFSEEAIKATGVSNLGAANVLVSDFETVAHLVLAWANRAVTAQLFLLFQT